METTSQVACFIAARIEATGQLQKDIAAKAGFDKPNMITMIKQGRTRLPLDKVGAMALALETGPKASLANVYGGVLPGHLGINCAISGAENERG